ncbi:STAS domain-containing protein [Streptomyces lancefieldiae]|uniref:Anti-sigma factor antagonist n=1 Tax=Streptomyces lancefieldiae TaxID=3075520 RepID=A0ABU3B0X8_9ACTN|nr:STAS domain-containing protein [Streptomyces sp. DSM 40712]MDT0616116.1 STAS domain-containing protein [Streptomyces sp. DSM 40712]
MARRAVIVRDELFTVSCDVINGWTVVEVDGEVDVRTHAGIRKTVDLLLGDGHRDFVLDLCAVPFLDSMGLGMVVAVTKRIRALEGSLRITCPSAQIIKVFRSGGLGDAYEFYDSPQEATRQAPTFDGLAHWPGPRP